MRAPQAWPGQRDGPSGPVGDGQVHVGPAPAPSASVSERCGLLWTRPGAGRCRLSGTRVLGPATGWHGSAPRWSRHVRTSRLPRLPPPGPAPGPSLAPGLPWRQESCWAWQPWCRSLVSSERARSARGWVSEASWLLVDQQEPWDRCGRRGVAAQRSLPSPPHLSRGRAGLSGSRAPGPGRPGTRACPCPSWRAVGAPAAFLPVRSPFQGCCGRLWSSICLWSGYLVCR